MRLDMLVAAQRIESLAGTAWIHSLVLLASAWVLQLVLRRAAPVAMERVWRFALVGGIATALIAFYLVGMPVRVHAEGPPHANVDALPRPYESVAIETVEIVASKVPSTATVLPREPAPALDEQPVVWFALGALWLGVVLWFLLREVQARWRLHAHVRARGPVNDPDWTDALRAIEQRAGWRGRAVTLTGCPALNSPIAFGRWRSEICVPTRALDELSAHERDAMLAHELAHLERRDSSRQTLTRWIAALTLQPLGPLAARRLRDLAELQCDARACELTGRPAALARCLARVAGWIAGPAVPLAPAMARPGAALERRVRCLVQGAPRRRRRSVYVAALAATVLVAWCAPRVTLTVPAFANAAIPLHEVPGTGLDALDAELAAAEAEVRELIALARQHASPSTVEPVCGRMTKRLERLRTERERVRRQINGEER